jgi:hypothetical protein
MMEEQMAPEAAEGEDGIVDQIGQLMAQLSPEKQAAVLAQLSELAAPAPEEMAGTVSPEGGPRGVPVGV